MRLGRSFSAFHDFPVPEAQNFSQSALRIGFLGLSTAAAAHTNTSLSIKPSAIAGEAFRWPRRASNAASAWRTLGLRSRLRRSNWNKAAPRLAAASHVVSRLIGMTAAGVAGVVADRLLPGVLCFLRLTAVSRNPGPASNPVPGPFLSAMYCTDFS